MDSCIVVHSYGPILQDIFSQKFIFLLFCHFFLRYFQQERYRVSTQCCMTRHAGTPRDCGIKLLSGSVAGPLTGSVTQIPHSRRHHAGSRTHLLKRCPFRPTQCTIGRLVPVHLMIAPSGMTPWVARRQSETSNLRARATIIRLRLRP